MENKPEMNPMEGIKLKYMPTIIIKNKAKVIQNTTAVGINNLFSPLLISYLFWFLLRII